METEKMTFEELEAALKDQKEKTDLWYKKAVAAEKKLETLKDIITGVLELS